MTTPDHPASPEATDDSLLPELAYLEALLTSRPAVTPIVLHRLGALGAEAHADLRRLRAERCVRLDRARLERLARRARQRQVPARVAAAVALVVTSPTMATIPAVAATEAEPPIVVPAPSKFVVVRIIDTNSGKPLAGVRIRTVAEELVGITDAKGQAHVPRAFQQESVLTLEKPGYPMILLEGERLATRSLIAMKKFSDPSQIADEPIAPAAADALAHAPLAKMPPMPKVDDPGERLMALAMEHSKPVELPGDAPAAPLLAEAPPATAEVPNTTAIAAASAPMRKPAGKALRIAAAPKAAPVTLALAPEPVAIAAAPEAPIVAPPVPAPAAKAPAKGTPDAKAAPAVATAPEARKAVAKVAFADTKAPRALRVVMRSSVAQPMASLPEAPVPPPGVVGEQLAARPAIPPIQPAGVIVPAPAPVSLPHHPTPPANPAHATHAAPLAEQHAALPIAMPKLPEMPKLPAMPKPAAAPVHHAQPVVKPPANLALPIALPHAPALPKLAPALPRPAAAVVHEAAAAVAKPLATIKLPPSPRFARKLAQAAMAKAAAPERPHHAATAMAGVAHDAQAILYRVRRGDMLSTIALRELGSASLWPALYEANRDLLTNPRWLQVGVQLRVPRSVAGMAAAGAETYVVRDGDTLSAIARDHMGDFRKWPQIFAANRHLIRNPWLIFPGQRLILPVHKAAGVASAWANLVASEAPPSDAANVAGGVPPVAHAD